MELTLLSRLLLAAQIPSDQLDGADLGGATTARFNPERLTGMGQSMGSTIGVSWAAIDPRLKAIVLSGSGGSMAEIATDAVEPFDVQGVLQAFLQPGRPIERNHPLLHAMQNVWDMVDPVTKANRLIAEPFDSIPAKHVLMPAGIIDGYFSARRGGLCGQPQDAARRSGGRTLHSRVAALVGTRSDILPRQRQHQRQNRRGHSVRLREHQRALRPVQPRRRTFSVHLLFSERWDASRGDDQRPRSAGCPLPLGAGLKPPVGVQRAAKRGSPDSGSTYSMPRLFASPSKVSIVVDIPWCKNAN